jgi:hypothetical protein
VPPFPTPEPFPASQQEVTAMRYLPNAAMPSGPSGSVPGSVSRHRLGLTATAVGSKPAPLARHPWSVSAPQHRLGRDCQSPDRDATTPDLTRTTWRCATSSARTAAATAAAKK